MWLRSRQKCSIDSRKTRITHGKDKKLADEQTVIVDGRSEIGARGSLNELPQARHQSGGFHDERFANSVVESSFVGPECVSIYNRDCIRVSRRLALVKSTSSEPISIPWIWVQE